MNRSQTPMPSEPQSARCPVIVLDERRLIELERSLAQTRARLGRLQRKRLKIDLKAGKLWRKLARLRREATACTERLAKGGGSEETDGRSTRAFSCASLFGRR